MIVFDSECPSVHSTHLIITIHIDTIYSILYSYIFDIGTSKDSFGLKFKLL